MFWRSVAGAAGIAMAWVLMGGGAAVGQSRPVVTTVQPTMPIQQPGELGILASLGDFDMLGVSGRPVTASIDPHQQRVEVIDGAITFAAEAGNPNAFGSLASGGSVLESCAMFVELTAVEARHDRDNFIIAEGIKAGVIPIDAGNDGYYETADGDYRPTGVLSRGDALEVIASHPAVADWLRQAARGQLLFERRLDLETRLLWELGKYCEEPTDRFTYRGDYGPNCEPGEGGPHFVERSLYIGPDVFDFLYKAGVRNFEILCATVNLQLGSKSVGDLIFRHVAFEAISAPAARVQSLSIEDSVALGRVDLSAIASAGGVDLRNTSFAGLLNLTRANLGGAVFFNNVDANNGVALSSATIQGPLYIDGSTFSPYVEESDRATSLDFYALSTGSLVIRNSTVRGHTDARFLTSVGEIYIGGSTFGTADRTSGDNGITLFGAQVREQLRVVDTNVLGSVSMDGASIEEALISRSTISKQLLMARSDIVGSLTMTNVHVAGFTNLAMISIGGEVSLVESRFGEAPTQDVRLSFTGAGIGAGLYMRGLVVIGGLKMEAARIGMLSLVSSDVSGTINLDKAHVNRGIRVNGLKAGAGSFSFLTNEGETYIARSVFGDPAQDSPTNTLSPLDFYGATLQRTFWLNASTIYGSAGFRAGIYESVLFQDSVITGNLRLNDSRTAALRIGEGGGVTIGRTLEMRSITAQLLIVLDSVVGTGITAPNASFGSLISLSGVDVHGPVSMPRAVARGIAITGLRATRISAAGLAVENNIEFDRVTATELILDGVSANHLGVNTVMAGSSPDPLPRPSASNPCIAADLATLPAPSVATASALVESARLLNVKGTRCIDTLKVVGANIAGNFDIGGTIPVLVQASSSNIGGQFMLAGAGTHFGKDACAIARNVRVDTIVYDLLDPSGQTSNPYAPAVVDVYGADFRMISASEPHALTRPGNDEEYLAAFLRDASGCGRPGAATTSGEEYLPAVYDALAAGQERAGNLDLARRIKVLKNRAYAETLVPQGGPVEQLTVMLTRTVYWAADVVSGYGYENIKAIIWLAGITLLGFLFGWIGEERLARLLDPLFGRSSRPQPVVVPPPVQTTAPRRGPKGQFIAAPKMPAPPPAPQPPAPTRRTPFFFVLDRSVPSLSLDDAFAKHEGLGFYLSNWYYVQRILCFLILLLMVAGAFNVFQ